MWEIGKYSGLFSWYIVNLSLLVAFQSFAIVLSTWATSHRMEICKEQIVKIPVKVEARLQLNWMEYVAEAVIRL